MSPRIGRSAFHRLPRASACAARLVGPALLLLAGCGEDSPATLMRTRDLLGALDGSLAIHSGAEPNAGAGFREPERHADGTRWAWIEGDRAELELPVLLASEDRLWLRVAPLPELANDQSLELIWNGTSLGQRPLEPGEQLIEYALPAGALQRGMQRLELRAGASALAAGEHDRPNARPLSIKCDFALLAPAGSSPDAVRARGRALDELPLRSEQSQQETRAPERPASPSIELAAGRLLRAPTVTGSGERLELRVKSAESARLQVLLIDLESGAARAEHLIALEQGHNAVDWAYPALDQRRTEIWLAALDSPVELEFARVQSNLRATPIVFIVVDTLRADAITRDDVETPNIDRLAADGHRFALARSHAPMTLPSHTALFSSRLPQSSGVLNNGQLVPQNLPLASLWLRDQGYTTAAAISLGTLKPFQRRHGLDRGFDRYLFLPQDVVPAERMHELLEDLLGVLRKASPFFLFAHYCDPHEPYDAHGTRSAVARVRCGDEALGEVQLSQFNDWAAKCRFAPGTTELVFESDVPMVVKGVKVEGDGLSTSPGEGKLREPVKRFSLNVHNAESEAVRGTAIAWINDWIDVAETRRRYDLEVEHVDDYVGALLDELRDAGLYEDSLIVFTSDHGESLGERLGFVGHVEHLFDDLLHVPLIVKLPREMRPEQLLPADLAAPVRHMDVLPSMLDALGMPPLPGQEGRAWRDGGERIHVAETHRPEAWRNLVSISDASFKLVHEFDRDIYELYDLRQDPNETKNVYAARGDERAEWMPRLLELSKRGKELSLLIGEVDPSLRERLEAMGYVGGK